MVLKMYLRRFWVSKGDKNCTITSFHPEPEKGTDFSRKNDTVVPCENDTSDSDLFVSSGVQWFLFRCVFLKCQIAPHLSGEESNHEDWRES